MSPKTPGEGDDGSRRRGWQPPAAGQKAAGLGKPATATTTPTAGRQATAPARAAGDASAKASPDRPSSPTRSQPALRKRAGPAGSSGGQPAAARVDAGRSTARGGFRVPGAGSRGSALISRGERILFWTLLAAVVGMSIFLARYRARVDAHFQARAMSVPLAAAGASGVSAPMVLYLADDNSGTLSERPLGFPLPQDVNTRARVVLEKLLTEYSVPGSLHPLQPGLPGAENVDEVYLMPVPGSAVGSHAQLAVVDLAPAFVHRHPSGIEPETLTLLSMIATLHANLPSVTEVRFLVDGEPRTTLAGHADLTRTYLAGPAEVTPGEAFTTRP